MNFSNCITVLECKELFKQDKTMEDVFFYSSLVLNFILLITTVVSEATAMSNCKANSLTDLFCGKCRNISEDVDNDLENNLEYV